MMEVAQKLNQKFICPNIFILFTSYLGGSIASCARHRTGLVSHTVPDTIMNKDIRMLASHK